MESDRFTETFREEASELLDNLETLLLDLERKPDDKEILSAVFRAMHTIKGSAGMVGFDRISRFAHEVESILSALRDGKIPYSTAITDNTLLARDYIRGMLDGNDTSAAENDELESFLAAFARAVGFEQTAAQSGAEPPRMKEASPTPARKKRSLHITFKPGPDILQRGMNPVALVAEVRALGESVCIPNTDSIPPLSELAPERCLACWDIFIRTEASDNDIRDIFVFVEDVCALTIEDLEDSIDDVDSLSRGEKKLGEILVDRGKIDKETIERILGSQKKIGEILVEEKAVTKTDIKIALEEQKQIQSVHRERKTETDLSSIRVRSEKLDQLMALVGELVTVQARVFESARRHEDDADFLSVAEQFGRLTDELRANTMSIRMVSVGSTFSGFKRLVRDLSNDLGKKVELEISGEETELDKTVIEKLHDPLVHIVRNSLDHGIETPAIRVSRGKSETGKLALRAEQTGYFVLITIEDDGNGLSSEAIRNKAIKKGILAKESEPTTDELLRLILLPGFSTSETITAISGRGVGMDVVNRQMEAIGGTIAIETEEKAFTRFILKIPLTLAIIDGLLVRVADEYYIVPLSAVRGCEEIGARTADSKGQSVIVYQNRHLPTIDLRSFFEVPGKTPDIAHIVVISAKGILYGLIVDHILGGTQAVIKPLGTVFKDARGISGASIRGDGSVALILDVENIIS